METSTRLAEEVLKEARQDIRIAVWQALAKIRNETGLIPAVKIYIDDEWDWLDSQSQLLDTIRIEFHHKW